jgi:hypothetical protein
MSKASYKKKIIKFDNREFLVQLLPFDNGNFISITEGKEKIGMMVVSIGSRMQTSTAMVIPSNSDSFFLKMVSERVASTINGICIVSISIQKELGLETMKAVMNEIMEIVRQ